MFLLSQIEAGTASWVAALDATVLGLGLGMVMQVLILAVQNSVPHSVLGVATSGSTMFRQIGGSIGVALFGTIFASQLHSELAARLPAGTTIPNTINPAGIKNLPPAQHHAFADAVATALHPVFLVAGGVSIVAFLLTWLLRDVPLQSKTQVGDAIPAPGDEHERAHAAA
jgi:hypothetical protein